ncbi:unnamed protein product [Heligmosomoides polygyrus]|uniref:VPS13 domain-containing protein n=1 Tax=Heligmosomoides polygyrus TaxID=6339 RepID=A0A183GRY5_HELPZ|nr:unnamed protein product [Heligmosomoides polygyrus]
MAELDEFSHRMQAIVAGPVAGCDALAARQDLVNLSCSVTRSRVGMREQLITAKIPFISGSIQLEIEVRSKKSSQMASASSGYGSSSASSESDQEISEQMQLRNSIAYKPSLSTLEHKSRPVDRWRRRTVPVSLESASNDDVMRILLRDGHAILIETDVVSF